MHTILPKGVLPVRTLTMHVVDQPPCFPGLLSSPPPDHRHATASTRPTVLHGKGVAMTPEKLRAACGNRSRETEWGARRAASGWDGSGSRSFESFDDNHGDNGRSDDCDAVSRPSRRTSRSPLTRPILFGLGRISSASLNMVFFILLAVILPPCAAVQVPFENCLPIYYTGSNPTPLQWVPKFVDATLNVTNDIQSLKVTMWGNVTGSRRDQPLPPANNTAYWTDPKQIEGKIQKMPNAQMPDTQKRVLTTLNSKINVLTYEPWSGNFDFCGNLSQPHTCPLGPVFDFNSTSPRDSLPSVFLANNFTTSYAFTSWSATFLIKYTDSDVLNIGCVSATITPDLGSYVPLLKFLPVGILAFIGFATIFAATFSPWGTTDVFRWSSNYGRDHDLLRLVTPGFGDCLQYIQFVVLTGGLSLHYPGFYQPVVSQLSWSALMFNQSFVTKEPGYQSVQDGIYVIDGVFSDSYGLRGLAQLTGMGNVSDIWTGMMIWLLAIIAAVITGGQIGFAVRWIYRKVKNIAEEDLRAKGLPFTVGNVVRIVFNYFLLPIVALSTFQLVVATISPMYTVVLAVVTLILIIGFAAWLLYLIITIKPRGFLFDDLPTLLLYGPLYNTYSDEAATFALIPLFLTFIRGIAVGAVQPVGIVQIVMLAICEVVQIITIHSIRPFHSPTSMNAYHTIFATFRLVSVILMIAFVPSLGVTEGPRGWIGYAILMIHACVMGFGFFLNALQTTLEVAARLSGAGGDSARGLTRGGLSKIFGMRQLRRREGPSRSSQLSTAGMLDQEEAQKTGYIMPSGRLRSESAGSGALLSRGQRSSSALDNHSVDAAFAQGRQFDGSSSFTFTPTTPGEASTFSFLPSPAGQTRHPLAPAAGLEAAADPYYRPPRRRGATLTQGNMTPPRERNRGSWAGSGDMSQRRFSQGPLADPADMDAQISRGPTPAPGNYSQPTISPAPRTDYSTREVDFYYGVRGQRLNSDAPSRKLGTGPADPTSPMSSAAGWFRNIIGGKTKEKGKGFEVVRSSRMPPAMKARGGDITDDAAPQGIPVAMSMLRNGPIESDDEDEGKRKKSRAGRSQGEPGEARLLDEDGNPKVDNADDAEIPKISENPPMLPSIESAGDIQLPSRVQSKASRVGKTPPPPPLDFSLLDEKGVAVIPPVIPRKSSRRDSTGGHSRESSLNAINRLSVAQTAAAAPSEQGGHHLAPTVSATPSRLPFERNNSQKRHSSGSSLGPSTSEFSNGDLQGDSSRPSQEERTTMYGYVSQGSVNRIDPQHPHQLNLVGSSAEVVDERR
ncbi:hypothetical protein RB595_009253 [Gaeumannomyces hyphopodioides]